MYAHRQRFEQGALLHADVVRQLEAKVRRMLVESGEVAVVGRRGAEDHLGTKVVLALLAVGAVAAGYSGLDGHTIANLQGGHLLAQLRNHASGFMANNHWLGRNSTLTRCSSGKLHGYPLHGPGH